MSCAWARKSFTLIGGRPVRQSEKAPLPNPRMTRPGASALMVAIELTVTTGFRSGAGAM